MNKLIVVFISILSFHVYADGDFSTLEGQYAMTGEYTSDTGNSHLRLILTGKSARDLYSAMDTEIVIDSCTEVESKNIGYMQCLFYKDSNRYECHFSINLAEQTIMHGVPC